MKFVNIRSSASRESLLSAISDNDFVTGNVKPNEKGMKPYIHVKEKNGNIRIKCEMKGAPTKDNGFLVGTIFLGKLKERDGCTTLRGIIMTSPIYHLIVIAVIAFIVYQCIVQRGFNVFPIFLLLFDYILFKNEFKKQGYIQRYLYRAARLIENK